MSAKSFLQDRAKQDDRLFNNVHFSVIKEKLSIISPQHFEPKHLPFFSAILENEQVNAQLIQPFQEGHLAYACSIGQMMMDKYHHFEKVNDPLSFIQLNDLSAAFSFFQTGETIIIVDRDKELWHTNATGRFETFQTGQEITLKDGQQATLLGLDLEASYDHLQMLGMMSEIGDRYHHDEHRADPTPVVAAHVQAFPPDRKFSVHKVIVNLCELYRNNETSLLEQPDFKRRFDRHTDPLVEVHGFSAKQLYTDPDAVNSFLMRLPQAAKVAMVADRNSLYSLLSTYHQKAQNAVERFECAYGPVKDFCPAATEQVIAYLAFLDDRRMLGKDQLLKQGLERLEKAATMNLNTDYTSESFSFKDLKAHLSKSFENVDVAQHERHKHKYKTR